MSATAATAPPPTEVRRITTNRQRATLTTVAFLVLLLIGVLWSLSMGSQHIALSKVPGAIFHNATTDDMIIRSIRLPRVVLALCVGAALAVAGALMQAVAANPLAAPEIMGVNAGAVLVVVLA
ncbi:iron chelate uptake ABC transporter family permease subunit, partial [Kribbella sp. NPDC051952]|uniref:iron chelate uptake ABC transporter family permease subunit n=1 Tax=Kribbella sp. NPDC051952 TaxID=3154851 RepID=UPI00342BA9F4